MSTINIPDDELRIRLEKIYDEPGDRIRDLRDDVSSKHAINRRAELFHALSNENRLRILETLSNSTCCGCELQAVLDISQSTISMHIQKLKRTGLVDTTDDGHWTYYELTDQAFGELFRIADTLQEDKE